MTLIVLLATLSARRAVLPEDRVVRRSSLLRGGADAPAYDPLHVGVTPVTVPFAVAGETEWPSDAAPAWPDDDVAPVDEEDEEVAEADYVGVTHYAEEPAMDAAAEVLADLEEVLAESPADLVAAPEPEPSPEPTVSLMSPVSIASVALASQFLLFCFALLMTARNRARWRRILGHLDRRGEAHGAAVISAFIGGISPHAAMTVALASFRGLPFGELTEEDLRHAREHDGRADGDTLAAHSTPIEFGGCDGFVSHAWADDHTARWRALSRWAKDFRLARSRDPMCWLDKARIPPPPPPSALHPHLHTPPPPPSVPQACIDQSNIDESLKCLPVFLAGAQRMVILAGPSYPRRLWCIIEAFTFLRVGADPSRIKVIPLGLTSSRASGDATSATDRVRDAFAAFDIRDAQCYAADRDRLLGARRRPHLT